MDKMMRAVVLDAPGPPEAIPEMLQTAHGSLIIGLDAQPEQSILIRGGTSSVGMATAVLAERRGMTKGEKYVAPPIPAPLASPAITIAIGRRYQ